MSGKVPSSPRFPRKSHDTVQGRSTETQVLISERKQVQRQTNQVRMCESEKESSISFHGVSAADIALSFMLLPARRGAYRMRGVGPQLNHDLSLICGFVLFCSKDRVNASTSC